MIKKILVCCLFLFSVTAFALPAHGPSKIFACPQAAATSDPGFCPSFKTVADCHCLEAGYPEGMCDDMALLYDAMISAYGSLENACAAQTDTDPQTCVDDWTCYRNGGTDSQGRACSSTGNAC